MAAPAVDVPLPLSIDERPFDEQDERWRDLVGFHDGVYAYEQAVLCVAEGLPFAALRQVAAARRALDELERQAVDEARSSGSTWADVGRFYGITRQSAHERWGSGHAAS